MISRKKILMCMILLNAFIVPIKGISSHSLYTSKFSNTLLIINFNHPYYENIAFLNKLYRPFFPNIVFYGEKPHPEVIQMKTEKGFYVCDLIAHAIENNPDYEGYLFLEDDCVLNMWNCFSLDLDKIWLLPGFTQNSSGRVTPHFITCNIITKEWSHPWAWSSRLESIRNAFRNLTHKDLVNLNYNLGNNIAIATSADMFYFPAKFKNDVGRLCAVFKDVFIETAMPCILASLDKKENWEKVSIFFEMPQLHVSNEWPIIPTCVHPVKFSRDSNRNMTEQIFKRMLPGLQL